MPAACKDGPDRGGGCLCVEGGKSSYLCPLFVGGQQLPSTPPHPPPLSPAPPCRPACNWSRTACGPAASPQGAEWCGLEALGPRVLLRLSRSASEQVWSGRQRAALSGPRTALCREPPRPLSGGRRRGHGGPAAAAAPTLLASH